MNDYIIVGIAAIVSAGLIFSVVQWRFGSGLLTSIIRVVIVSVTLIAYFAFVLGKQGITIENLVLGVAVVVALIITTVLFIQNHIIVSIQLQSDKVSKVVKTLTNTSNEAAASAAEQSSTVAQVSTAVEEIHHMSQSTADTSEEVVKVTVQAVDQGREGIDAVHEALQVMERLAQTTNFVEVVNYVAEQSNLLAINAEIEAAKAEEYGRGFSVVASEVRNLAEQSKQAATQIRHSLRYTESGQQAIKSTDTVIAELGTVLENASEKARQISSAALQQSAGIKQISDAMENLVRSGQHTELTSKQIKDAAVELAIITHQLSMIIHGKEKIKNFLF